MILKRDIDGFAQRRNVHGLALRIAVAKPGAGETVDQLAERGDGRAGEPSAVVLDVAEAILDAQRELAVLGLAETLGETTQA